MAWILCRDQLPEKSCDVDIIENRFEGRSKQHDNVRFNPDWICKFWGITSIENVTHWRYTLDKKFIEDLKIHEILSEDQIKDWELLKKLSNQSENLHTIDAFSDISKLQGVMAREIGYKILNLLIQNE